MANMLRGHAAAYRAIHEIQPEARVGFAHHHRPMVRETCVVTAGFVDAKDSLRWASIWDSRPRISTGVMKSPVGNKRIPEAKGTQDFLGLNYYSVDTVSFDISKPR